MLDDALSHSIESMSVKLSRRRLRFRSFDDVLADAQQLVASPRVVMLGNWSLSQLLMHLSIAYSGSIDGYPASPWRFQRIGRLMLPFAIRKIPRGFKLRKEVEARVFPLNIENNDALVRLSCSITRVKSEPMPAIHPIFGRLTNDQWTKIHLRHAELHLSFAHIAV